MVVFMRVTPDLSAAKCCAHRSHRATSDSIIGIRIEPCARDCPWDLNGDGAAGPADLAIILGNWGPVPPNDPIADLNDDGVVGPADLAIVLGNWGPCE